MHKILIFFEIIHKWIFFNMWYRRADRNFIKIFDIICITIVRFFIVFAAFVVLVANSQYQNNMQRNNYNNSNQNTNNDDDRVFLVDAMRWRRMTGNNGENWIKWEICRVKNDSVLIIDKFLNNNISDGWRKNLKKIRVWYKWAVNNSLCKW